MRRITATLLLLLSFNLHAHRIKVFVAPEGELLVGYAYASGGDKLSGTTVTVFGPGQTKLAVIQTDAQGRFSYQAKSRCRYRFVVDSGDGHMAEYTVPAEELPPSLGPLPGQKTVAERAKPADAAKQAGTDTSHLSAQIHSLRRQLAEHDERVRLRDVLGGLGYIFGLMGVIVYFKARKKEA